MSYVVRQQRRDIGVRLALGATPSAMTLMVVARGVQFATAGCVAGAALALVAGRWLSSSTFAIQSTSVGVVFAVAITLAALAAIASWWPGRQAARIPTLEAMAVE
jgi:ABC-type antimicrobial peptide transport system permease subunit